MEKAKNFLANNWLVAIILLIPACWALFVPGFYGASDEVHIAWLYEMQRVIFTGQFPPRFVPDLSFGFGYPLFEFVFPLPFYISEIFHFLGFTLVDSIKGLFFISIPLSFLFMYWLLRQYASKDMSLVGALLYVYTPYRSVDIYVRGAIGEVLSFVFLPVIILSVVKISSSKSIRWVAIGAIAIASLVLSHNITAYMFMPFVLLFMFMQFFSTDNRKTFAARAILMIFLGLLVSLYFWLPAVVESDEMKYDTVFNFVDHFPTLKQLVTPYWGYGASVPGPGDGISFFLGTINILVLSLGLILTLKGWSKIEKQTKILVVWAFISIAVAVVFMNYRSFFLWSSIPMLPYFQFPWRFLILTTFSIPLLIVLFDKFRAKLPVAAILVILILITSASDFRPQDFLGRQDNYFLNRYIPTPVASSEYMKNQEEYLRLPKNTAQRPNQLYPLFSVATGSARLIAEDNALDVTIEVNSDQGSALDYNKYFFPGWVAKIDDQTKTIYPGQPFGQIKVDVPPGRHTVKIAFEETNFRKIVDATSLISFLVLLGMCLSKRSKKNGPLFWA